MQSTKDKTVSSRRRVRGLNSRPPLPILLQTEAEHGLRRLQASWYARLCPEDEIERRIVDQIVATDWRLSRCPSIEAGIAARQLSKASAEDGVTFQTAESDHRTINNLARYTAALSNEMDRLLKRFAYIQSIRPA